MPTAGRLAGALIFGLFGWYMATESIKFFPDEIAPGYFIPLFAAVGLVLGWRICGARSGRGYHAAIANGLTTGFAVGAWVLFIMAFLKMLENAFDMDYRGPMDAVVGVFYEMMDFGVMLFDPLLIAMLFGGAVICAWVTEFFGRRYP